MRNAPSTVLEGLRASRLTSNGRSLKALVVVVILAAAGRSAFADPTLYEPASDPGVGFNLISWWNFGGSGDATWQNAVQSVYDAGFREVSISPVRFVNIATGSILPTSPRGPESTLR